jgi:coiled-coil and C2 domain-containing protein 1
VSAFKHGDDIPKYHYEKRTYQMLVTNTDLTDDEFEVVIIRAINLPVPPGFDAKTMQTFVKFDLPIPPVRSSQWLL